MTRPGPKRLTYRSYWSAVCCLQGGQVQQEQRWVGRKSGAGRWAASCEVHIRGSLVFGWVGRHMCHVCKQAAWPRPTYLCSLSSPKVALLSIQLTMRPCTAMGTCTAGGQQAGRGWRVAACTAERARTSNSHGASEQLQQGSYCLHCYTPPVAQAHLQPGVWCLMVALGPQLVFCPEGHASRLRQRAATGAAY